MNFHNGRSPTTRLVRSSPDWNVLLRTFDLVAPFSAINLWFRSVGGDSKFPHYRDPQNSNSHFCTSAVPKVFGARWNERFQFLFKILVQSASRVVFLYSRYARTEAIFYFAVSARKLTYWRSHWVIPRFIRFAGRCFVKPITGPAQSYCNL